MGSILMLKLHKQINKSQNQCHKQEIHLLSSSAILLGNQSEACVGCSSQISSNGKMSLLLLPGGWAIIN